MNRFPFAVKDFGGKRGRNKALKKAGRESRELVPDSRALATVDAGCASSWGWGEASDQGDLSLGLNSCHSGNLLFSR
jgi:hypothetical protein